MTKLRELDSIEWQILAALQCDIDITNVALAARHSRTRFRLVTGEQPPAVLPWQSQ